MLHRKRSSTVMGTSGYVTVGTTGICTVLVSDEHSDVPNTPEKAAHKVRRPRRRHQQRNRAISESVHNPCIARGNTVLGAHELGREVREPPLARIWRVRVGWPGCWRGTPQVGGQEKRRRRCGGQVPRADSRLRVFHWG